MGGLSGREECLSPRFETIRQGSEIMFVVVVVRLNCFVLVCCRFFCLIASPARSQLDALEHGRRQWVEARRRCEVWAHKLDSSNCVTGRTTLAGFAEGGGPPRVCLRAMHASLREGYCKALR